MKNANGPSQINQPTASVSSPVFCQKVSLIGVLSALSPAAVSGRGEDEGSGLVLLREDLSREGSDLQRGADLDRWLQELHVFCESEGILTDYMRTISLFNQASQLRTGTYFQ